MSTVSEVRLWGRTIGAVALDDGADVASFEYDPAFVGSGIQLAPLTMPLSRQVYSFPVLARDTFHGLPGLLSDSLPDRFGNALINAWLATQGRGLTLLMSWNAYAMPVRAGWEPLSTFRRLGQRDAGPPLSRSLNSSNLRPRY